MEQTFQPIPRPTSSPWGGVDSAKEYGPGVWSVSTPSHGGFRLSSERNAAVADYWRSADGWYEEDCDWAIVCATWPELFEPLWRQQADVTLRNWYPDAYEQHYSCVLLPEQSYRKAERVFWTQHRNDYVARTAWSDMAWIPDGFVGVRAGLGERLPNGEPREERYFLVPAEEYRTGNFGFVIDRRRHREIPRPANLHERRPRHAA